MSEQFKVGDVVVVVGCKTHTEYNGMEGTVRAYMGVMQTLTGRGPVYEVCFASGECRSVAQWVLRKNRPPRRECDEVVSWDDCAWKPKHKETA